MEPHYRILVIDDNVDIHADFRKILNPETRASSNALRAIESALFDAPIASQRNAPQFEIDSAYQGEEGLRLVQESVRQNKRYHVVFCDMRMPPGWNGLRTSLELMQADPGLRIVICSAYCDYSADEIAAAIPDRSGQLSFRSKPFVAEDIVRLARSLAESCVAV
ncbi:MAG: response regulator [Phycisphaerae bacterium]|nr:response regulator [Phycisphaerae bacterium]